MGSKVNLDNCGITKEQADEIWRITRPKRKVDISNLDDDTQHQISNILLEKQLRIVREYLRSRKRV
jgi:hypothetical protein